MRVSSFFIGSLVIRSVELRLGERSIDSFPQKNVLVGQWTKVLGKSLDSLGKTLSETVDNSKIGCGISGGYKTRTIPSEILIFLLRNSIFRRWSEQWDKWVGLSGTNQSLRMKKRKN